MNARRALAFIFCTVTLDVLALGLMIPVLPRIVLGFMDNDTARAAEVFGLFATVWGAMQFICSPLLGALSDRYGRRPVILISCLGLGLDYIFMAVAPSLTLLFVGRVISGITAATITTSYAYIADVTEAEKRAKAFGLVGMAFGLGFVLGPAIGGLLGTRAVLNEFIAFSRLGPLKPTLDPRLSYKIIDTIKTWRFSPGHQDGVAVPMKAMIEAHIGPVPAAGSRLAATRHRGS